jgi:hypothetical protein
VTQHDENFRTTPRLRPNCVGETFGLDHAILPFGVIELKADKLTLKRNNDFITLGGKFPRLTKKDSKARVKEIKKLLLAVLSRLTRVWVFLFGDPDISDETP